MMIDRRAAMLGLAGTAGAGLAIRGTGSAPPDPGRAGMGAPAERPFVMPAAAPLRRLTGAQLPLGGGGFVTGIDVSSDGSRLVCRTDVANGYVRDRGDAAWRPLFSAASLAGTGMLPLPPSNDKVDAQGVSAVRIAPTNKDIVYATFYGYVWRSVDGARTFQRCRLPQKKLFTNSGSARLSNRMLDVSPTDAGSVLCGTYADGVWYSPDGGQRWDRVPVPESLVDIDKTPGNYLVHFSPTVRNRVDVFVTGLGLFRSDTGPAGPFTPISGGPTHSYGVVEGFDNDVLLFEYTGAATGKVWRYGAGGWTSAKANGSDARSAAVNPFRKGHVLATDEYGGLAESFDGGRTMTTRPFGKRMPGGEVAWISDLTWINPAEFRFAPDDPKTIYVADGVGVCRMDVATHAVTDMSAGIEELCINTMIVPPGGKLVAASLDRALWRIEAESRYSNNYEHPLAPGGSRKPDKIIHGWNCDYAGDDPNFMVGLITPFDDVTPGFSVDAGRSWRNFKGAPPDGFGVGGCIAASTSKNVVLLRSNNSGGVYTLDGGATWQSISLDGNGPTMNFANAYYVKRKNLAADKQRAGTFALVYTVLRGDFEDNPLGGVWVTRDGGKNWSQRYKKVISSGSPEPKAVFVTGSDQRQFWQCQLEYVPGRAGRLLYTPHADRPEDRFYWSDDDGASWKEADARIRNVAAFGFGKARAGSADPAVYFYGEYKKQAGLYASLDWFQSPPILLTTTPSPLLANIAAVAGHPDVFGRVYVGTSCAGIVKYDLEV